MIASLVGFGESRVGGSVGWLTRQPPYSTSHPARELTKESAVVAVRGIQYGYIP